MASYYDISYTLSDSEIYEGLKNSGFYKTSGKRALFETVILLVLFGVFAVSYVMNRNTFDIVMAAISLAVIVLIAIVPKMSMKKQVNQAERDVKMRIYQDEIMLYAQSGTVQKINLSETSVKKLKSGLILLIITGGGLLLIPESKLKEQDRDEVIALLSRDRG